MSCATCESVHSETNSVHREANGRFGKGNPGGPGNPFNRKVAANRAAFLEAAGPEEIKDVVRALYNKACGGDVAAAKVYLEYAIGKPRPAKEPDLMDVDEFEVAKAKRVPYSQAVIALIDMPVDKATEMAGSTPPTGDCDPDDDDDDHDDDLEEPEAQREPSAAAYKFVLDFVLTGKIPADSPFAPLPDGSDPELVAEHNRMLDVFAKALREGKMPDEPPFPPFDGGTAEEEFDREGAKSAKGRPIHPFDGGGEAGCGRREAVYAGS